jgi:hypothetical protein
MPWLQNPDTGESYYSESGVPNQPQTNKPQQPPPGAKSAPPAPGQPGAFGGTPEWWASQTGGQQGGAAQPTAQPAKQNWWDQPQQPPTQGASGHYNTTAPFGMDQSMPGVAEQNWQNNQDKWYQQPQLDWANTQMQTFGDKGFGEDYNQKNVSQFGAPGEGQQYWNKVEGKFNEVGQYKDPNLAAESYRRTVQNLPGSIQPTFDAAFDRASEKAVGLANSQASARGAYGSSAALNGVNSVITDIEAARANRHGDFALQDSANQRNWLDSAANQGRSADLSNLGAFGANLSGLGQFSDMAFRSEGADLARDKFASDTAFGIQDAEQGRTSMGIDSALGIDGSNLNRLNAGFNASSGAQTHRDNRLQGALDNVRNFQGDVTRNIGGQIEAMFGGNDAALQGAIEAKLGMTFNNKNDAINALQSNRQAMNDFMSLYNPGGGGGMPGGGGGG